MNQKIEEVLEELRKRRWVFLNLADKQPGYCEGVSHGLWEAIGLLEKLISQDDTFQKEKPVEVNEDFKKLVEDLKAVPRDSEGGYIACCIFHDYKHPSLYFNDKEFICFACGEKGTADDLREAVVRKAEEIQ